MKGHWQIRNGHRKALVFCNGWGMDHQPFRAMSSECFDVIILYDYRDFVLPEGFAEALGFYDSVELICWSMGVWGGQQLFADRKQFFKRRIAINGTLQPIDNQYGIPVDIYDKTLENYSPKGRDLFYRRMCKEPGVLETFRSMVPVRDVAGQKEELAVLRDMVKGAEPAVSMYTDVIISNKDLVMPAENQFAFWRGQKPVIMGGCHFPFTRWTKWEDITLLVGIHG